MKISFFEEFPNKESLSKLNLIDFPTKIFLADYHIESFKLYEKEIMYKNKNIKELIWWPVINVSEGYWLSPFSKRFALLRVFHSLLYENISILWDAELPKNRFLLFTQLFKFYKNKKLIKSFFKKYNGKIYTAEYSGISNKFLIMLFNGLCLFFNPKEYNNYVIKMFYSSMHNLSEIDMKNRISEGIKKYNDKFIVGLGVLSYGINKNEKLITPELLERDLEICKNNNVSEVVIFRLGGLNKEYLKIMKKFL